MLRIDLCKISSLRKSQPKSSSMLLALSPSQHCALIRFPVVRSASSQAQTKSGSCRSRTDSGDRYSFATPPNRGSCRLPRFFVTLEKSCVFEFVVVVEVPSPDRNGQQARELGYSIPQPQRFCTVQSGAHDAPVHFLMLMAMGDEESPWSWEDFGHARGSVLHCFSCLTL